MTTPVSREQILAAATTRQGRRALRVMREAAEQQLRVSDAQLADFERAREQTREVLRHIAEALGEVGA